MFVREADVAYPLGPASARPYLDLAVLERALVATRADAVWVGWGFVAEDPAFADLCERLGVTFIGPSAEAMRKLGDKIGSKLIAEEVGVPVAPWSRGGVDTLDEALAAADKVGYPLMLKATAGGGGRGIRMVAGPADLEDAYQRTRDEAERAFGSGVVFLERLVTGARHVEVQVIADSHGHAWALGRPRLLGAAPQPEGHRGVRLAAAGQQPDRRPQGVGRAARPRGRLRRRGDRRVPLPPRREDVRVPRGQHPAPGRAPDHRGDHGRRPGQGADPGRRRRQPRGQQARRRSATRSRHGSTPRTRTATSRRPRAGSRCSSCRPGRASASTPASARATRIPADFDSMIAKIIAVGSTRDGGAGPAASRHVRDDRGDRGRRHEQELHPRPARPARGRRRPAAWAGPTPAGSTGSAPRAGCTRTGTPASRSSPRRIHAYEDEERLEIEHLLETARGGRPNAQHEVGRAVDLKLRGTSYKVTVLHVGPHRFRVTIAVGRRRAGRRGRGRAARRVPQHRWPSAASGSGW